MSRSPDNRRILSQTITSKDAAGKQVELDATLILPPEGVELKGGILAMNGWDSSQTGLARQLGFLAEAANGYAVLVYDAQGVNDTYAKTSSSLRHQPNDVDKIARQLAHLAQDHPGQPQALLDVVHVANEAKSPALREAANLLAAAVQEQPTEVAERAAEMAKIVSTETKKAMGRPNSKDGDIETVTREANLNDGRAAYDLLRAHLGQRDLPIHGVGQSMGAGLMSALSMAKKLASKFYLMPADYQDLGFKIPQIEDSRQSPRPWPGPEDGPTRATTGLEKFDGPVTIVRPTDDQVVPLKTTQRFIASAPNASYLELPDTGHGIENYEQGHAVRGMLARHFTEATGQSIRLIERHEPGWSPEPRALSLSQSLDH